VLLSSDILGRGALVPGELELASVLPLAGLGHEVILVRRVA
jgi:hypothetical protein